MVKTFKVITWNVNSLRVRLDQVLESLIFHQPDIVALQETKLENHLFPMQIIQKAGYYCAFSGQKSYNGVAVFSRIPFLNVQTQLPTFSDLECRILSVAFAHLEFINIYTPNGSQLNSDKYHYKLQWLSHLQDYLQQKLVTTKKHIVVAGDFNIAPEDQDVYDPQALQEQILTSTAERTAFRKLLQLGLHDSFRLFEQPPSSYTWWDYRGGAFYRNQGLRIDHILVSDTLLPQCLSCKIDISPRRKKRPSDHAPVILTFAL